MAHGYIAAVRSNFMLQRPSDCLPSVMTRLNWTPPRFEDASRDARLLKQMVDVLQFEATRLREEEVHDWYLYMSITRILQKRMPRQLTQDAQKHANMINVRHPILSIAVGVICTTMTTSLVREPQPGATTVDLHTHIQLTNPPKACPRARMRVVVTSLG